MEQAIHLSPFIGFLPSLKIKIRNYYPEGRILQGFQHLRKIHHDSGKNCQSTEEGEAIHVGSGIRGEWCWRVFLIRN